MTKLEIKTSQHTGRVPVTLFELIGEMDASNSPQVQAGIQQVLDAGARYMVIDFSQVTYISSSGLRVIYSVAKALSTLGEQTAHAEFRAGTFKSAYLKLINPSQNVRKALEVMGFNMYIEIHSDLGQAIASF